jgi:hypothetical protein
VGTLGQSNASCNVVVELKVALQGHSWYVVMSRLLDFLPMGTDVLFESGYGSYIICELSVKVES